MLSYVHLPPRPPPGTRFLTVDLIHEEVSEHWIYETGLVTKYELLFIVCGFSISSAFLN